MNINGVARGYMAQNLSAEEFLKRVGIMIESQLKEWDPNYEVAIMKYANYELEVNNQDDYYSVHLTPFDIRHLQKSGLLQLDRRIWEELVDQGLVIMKGNGNYLDHVLL